MESKWEKDYPLVLNVSEVDLEENSSLKKMLRLVGENKRVIDFGCATGYFAQLLNTKGCQVTGVEVNPKAAKVAEHHCEQVIVADLDFVNLTNIVPEKEFDVAVFGDVLEHLRDPWRLLEQTRQILKPEGYVVASIPNIAHGAIRLALLKGRFEYMEMGILDNTHLRFFTRKTVEELFEASGYSISVMERTKLPIFSESSLVPLIEKKSFDSQIIQEIEQDEEADTLQFIFRAYPLSLEGKYAALNEKYYLLVEELKSSHSQIEQITVELKQTQIEIQEKNSEIERSQSQIHQQQAELERSQLEIQEKQVSLDLANAQLQNNQVELESLRLQLQQTQAELSLSQLQTQQAQAELEQLRLQLQQTQGELAQSQSQLQQTQGELAQSQSQLQQRQAELKDFQSLEHQKQHKFEVELKQLQDRITAMESSKFWRLRTEWFKLKRALGLKVNE